MTEPTSMPTQSQSSMGALLVVVVLVVIIGIVGLVFWRMNGNTDKTNQQPTATATPTTTVTATPTATPTATGNTTVTPTQSASTFTTAQLATFNGVNGKECYVAIDTTVYKIEGVGLWQNGQHVAPGAVNIKCGMDLTQQIATAPHERSKLSQLTVVGTYVQ